MLIRFSLENFMSFADKAEMSLIASKERQHGDRVAHIKKFSFRLLPIAAIYGGNASGKTNLFRAISFAKRFIVSGTQLDHFIPVEPYRLNNELSQKPSGFRFEIYIDGQIYEFGFSTDKKQVHTEWLTLLNPRSETPLYKREMDKMVYWDASLKDDQFMQFSFQGTRSNQLFLTNSVLQKVERFMPVYRWFRDTLELIAPDARFQDFGRFISEDNPLYASMNGALSKLDTGITRLGGEVVPWDQLPIPDEIKSKILETLPEGSSGVIESNDSRIVITKKKDGMTAKRLSGFHLDESEKEMRIEYRYESDGTRRVIDLLPAFLTLEEPKAATKVFIIDELDRSLHTLMTRGLIEGFLSSCTDTPRGQLLFTTHDVQLMDQSLFRRDEMFVVERTAQGRSHLVAFSDFNDVRYDKDIRKSYLQGRLGGIPRIPEVIRE